MEAATIAIVVIAVMFGLSIIYVTKQLI